MKVHKEKIVKVWVETCDTCGEVLDPKQGDEVVRVIYRKLGKGVKDKKQWENLKKELHHGECYDRMPTPEEAVRDIKDTKKKK